MDNSHSSVRTNTNVPLTGIVLCLVVIIGIFMLSDFKLIPTTNPKPTLSTPTPRASDKPKSQMLTFQGCDIKKEGNPLVDGVYPGKDLIYGTFYGNIDKVNKESSSSATLLLLSPKGDQSYSLNVKDEPNLVFDATTLKNVSFSTLKPGLTVSVTFNCYPQKNNLLKIASIAIRGDLTKK